MPEPLSLEYNVPMAKQEKIPNTPAVHTLKKHRVPFTRHQYAYVDHGGTRHAAEQLNREQHCVIKTLVMKSETSAIIMVLMHGDATVSQKRLARALGHKRVEPCTPQEVYQKTGYKVGGVSPLGSRQALPVFMQSTILEASSVLVNGGRRGFLVELAPGELLRATGATLVDVAHSDP